MNRIKIITYLKKNELSDIQIKSLLERLKLNPEELINEEIKEKIDNEIEIYKKPQKKVVIKRKIIKKVAIKAEEVSTEEKVEEKEEESIISTPTAHFKEIRQDEVVSTFKDERKEECLEEKSSIKKETEIDIDETKIKELKQINEIEAQEQSEPTTTTTETEKARTSFSYNKKYTYTPSGNAAKTETDHHKKRIFIKKPPAKKESENKREEDKKQYQKFNQHKQTPFARTFKNTPVIQVQPVVTNYQKNKKKHDVFDYEISEKDELHSKLNRGAKKRKDIDFAIPEEIEIPETITVSDLAKKMNIKANVLIQKLFEIGNTVTINQFLDADTAEILLSYFNCKVKRTSMLDSVKIPVQTDLKPILQKRPPIVTVLGHVDHGKTTLLDRIRKTNVAAGEVGGITQRIGAYKVKIRDEEIVFIDTPGHEAFTLMRARGASATDIAILIVAADDGVMPQTIEALNHAKAAKVPIVVAINKCDKPGAKIEKIKTDLANLDLLPQEWGGDTIYVEISALKGTGIDQLLDSILLIAELLELKADYNPKKWAEGIILESRLDKGRGIIATVLVKNGILKERDVFIAGNYEGKVRSMIDENGKKLEKAYPSTPIEVIGFEELPEAGSIFSVVDSEKTAKEIARKRRELESFEKQKESSVNLANVLSKINKGEVGQLNLIIKADVQGMAEALKTSCEKLSVSQINVNVIHYSVGAITESDVNLAVTSKSIIIGFNTKPTKEAQIIAEREGVEIRKYNIIYDVIEDIKNSITGLAAPKIREEIIGEVEIRQVFNIPSIGIVGGGFVTKGVVAKDSLCRIYRDNIVIHTGKLASLYHFKNPAKEVKQGLECGLTIEKFNDLKEKDILEIYKNVEEKVNFEELAAIEKEDKEKNSGN